MVTMKVVARAENDCSAMEMLDAAHQRGLCSHFRDARCPLAVPRQHPATLPEKPPLQPEEQIQDTQGKDGGTGRG